MNSIHNFSKRLKWRAFFFLNPDITPNSKETFGLNTSLAPPPIKDLKPFLDGLCDIAKNLKFRKVNNKFLNTLKDDLKEINNEDKVFLAADKTRNMYKVEKEAYNEHLESNFTKEYKKARKKNY